jgi:phosphohistidine phosphatase
VDLFVIRHAIAAPREDYADDAARPLTRKGAKRFEQVVRGLEALGVEVHRVLHSPWRRAVETSERLGPIVPGELAEALVATDLLTASPGPALCHAIALASAGGAVAVVGHEPWLAELVATLAFGDARLAARMPLRKGGVAWLDGTPAPGEMDLRAFLPPMVLRRTDR